MSFSIAALPKLGGYERYAGRPLTPVNGTDARMVFSPQANLICCDLLLCDIRVMIPPMTFPACPLRHPVEAEP
ncbi:MAG: hypothetical protein ACM3O5_09790 [Betaproteobacteria bacterium]